MSAAPASAPLLTYEQPLKPGELRLDLAPDALTIKWSLPARQSRKNLVKVSLWALAYLCFFAYRMHDWLNGGFRWSGLGGVVLIGIFTLLILAGFISSVCAAGATFTILANRENLVFDDAVDPVVIPMKGIRHFTTRFDRNGDCALVLVRWKEKVRWYQLRVSSPPPSSVDVLVHPNTDLVESAAASLNALLAAGKVPAQT
jgi:hypothetical protein